MSENQDRPSRPENKGRENTNPNRNKPSNRRYNKGRKRPGSSSSGGRGPRAGQKGSVNKEIFISSTPFESRVALLEKGRLAEFYVERPKDRGITGNVYKGKVVSVLPGMQAAFIDMGLDRTAFLHASDLIQSFEGFDVEDDEEATAAESKPNRNEPRSTKRADEKNIDSKSSDAKSTGETVATPQTPAVVTEQPQQPEAEDRAGEEVKPEKVQSEEAKAEQVQSEQVKTIDAPVEKTTEATTTVSLEEDDSTGNEEVAPALEKTSADEPRAATEPIAEANADNTTEVVSTEVSPATAQEEVTGTTEETATSEDEVTTEVLPALVKQEEVDTTVQAPTTEEANATTEATIAPEGEVAVDEKVATQAVSPSEGETTTTAAPPAKKAYPKKDYKKGGRGGRFKREPRKDPRIEDICKEGDEHVMQITKEPLGSKGARVSGFVSLPGRYLVLMPSYSKIGVSKRISTDRERRRLRSIVRELRPDNSYGFIVRTVCDGVSKEDIKTDMEYLVNLWKGVEKNAENKKPPLLLSEELDLTLRVIRDMFSTDVTRILLDSKEDFDRVMKFADEFMPKMKRFIHLYKGGDVHMFDAFGIEVELTNALGNKVWLRSGGHLVIDQMEALTAVDVNTGKFVGKKSSDDTILKTNLEAVKEVVHQLRLRNIGGIIVVDFIDMARYQDREKVYNAFKDALRVDKARTNILKVSDLGLVEMTRKRLRESITQTLCESCPQCEGSGVIKNKDAIAMEIYRDISYELDKSKRKISLFTNPVIADYITNGLNIIDDLTKRYKTKIAVSSVEVFQQEEYEIH